MANALSEAFSRTTKVKVPKGKSRGIQIVLGIVNLFLFGIGTIIAGVIDNELSDVIIGLFQLFLPFIGWIWSFVWGILMIIGR